MKYLVVFDLFLIADNKSYIFKIYKLWYIN